MDIARYFQPYYEKLKYIDYQNIFDNCGQINTLSKNVGAFKNHLPLIGETFWETALSSCEFHKDNHTQPDLREDLLDYINALIKWYNVEKPDRIGLIRDDKSAILSCRFYLNLISLNLINNDIMFHTCLKCLKLCSGKIELEKHCIRLLNDLKNAVRILQLNDDNLKLTLSILISVIEKSSYLKINNVNDETPSSHLCQEGLKCLKCLLLSTENEENKNRKITIYHSILNGVKIRFTRGGVSDKQNYIQENCFVLISDLRSYVIGNETEFQCFLVALSFNAVGNYDVDHKEIVRIMNAMGELFYKATVDRLILICHAKDTTNKQRDSIIKIFGLIFKKLPMGFYTPDKIPVLIQNLIKACLLCFHICDESVYVLSEVCNSDLRGEVTKLVTSSDATFSMKNTLPVVCKRLDTTFTNRQTNKQTLVIFFHLLSVQCNKYSVFLYQYYMEVIGDGIDPVDVKPSIPRITDAYISTTEDRPEISKKLVKFLYRMAVHPSNQSIHFLQLLFKNIVHPNEQMKHFRTDVLRLLTTEIELEKYSFFDQCWNNNLINETEMTNLIGYILNKDFAGLKLTCKFITGFKTYSNLLIIKFLVENEDVLTNSSISADLLFIASVILRNYKRPNELIDNLKKLLNDKLLNYTIPFNAVGNLLKITSPNDMFYQSINEKLNEYFTSPLDSFKEPIPVMYAAELLITSKDFTLNEEIQTKLLSFVKKLTESDLSTTKSETRLYYCLTLLLRLTIRNHELTQTTWQHLKKSMKNFNGKNISHYLSDLIFDFCIFSTFGIEEYLPILFNNLISNDRRARKQAINHLVYFIHHDQLKPSPQQFCLLVATLSDPAISYSVKNELKLFMQKQQQLIEKYFFTLILHFSFYETNDFCPMSPIYTTSLKKILTDDCNKWKVYSDSFRLLSKRSQFMVLHEVANQFFVRFIGKEISIEGGIWEALNSCISLYKVSAYEKLSNNNLAEFCDRQKCTILHAILKKKGVNEDAAKYPEHRDSIGKITLILLRLMFFTDDEDIFQKYHKNLFEAIMLWTYVYLYDIVSFCENKYSKLGIEIYRFYDQLITLYERLKSSLLQNEIISEFNEMSMYNFAQILERE